MTIIYSERYIKGLEGTYIAPRLFDGANITASKVYTDDDKIAKSYGGVEVLPITPKKTTKK